MWRQIRCLTTPITLKYTGRQKWNAAYQDLLP